ncbi:MAG: GAF domain-containing protein, partial [Myxococcota bacterium]
MPSLKWVVAEGRPRVFPIYKKVTSIGRGAANDVAIDEPSLAEFHAQIVFDGRDFTLAEVERAGGLHVNGKKKRRAKIFHNDRLELGENVELVFSVYDEVAPGVPAEDDHQAELAGMVKLSEFNARLLEIDSVADQIDALLDAVIEVTDAAKGFVLLLREGEPSVAAARNVKRESIPAGVEQLSDSIVAQVIERRMPVIVSDALNDTMFKTAESVMNLRLCSVMAAPLMAQGQLLGIIYVGNDNVVSLFEESSLDVLTIFAGQASLILQNAILLDELNLDRQRMAGQLEDQRFGDIIGSCPSLLEVFGRVEKVAATDVSVLITGETG